MDIEDCDTPGASSELFAVLSVDVAAGDVPEVRSRRHNEDVLGSAITPVQGDPVLVCNIFSVSPASGVVNSESNVWELQLYCRTDDAEQAVKVCREH